MIQSDAHDNADHGSRDMNTANLAVRKRGLLGTGVILLAAISGGRPTAAETFQHGGSTATIEQSGGRGPSQSQVIRSKDGQTIITQDGSSTDITVQGSGGSWPPDASGERPWAGADPVERGGIDQRFSDDGPACPAVRGREAFKQRLLERLRRPAP